MSESPLVTGGPVGTSRVTIKLEWGLVCVSKEDDLRVSDFLHKHLAQVWGAAWPVGWGRGLAVCARSAAGFTQRERNDRPRTARAYPPRCLSRRPR